MNYDLDYKRIGQRVAQLRREAGYSQAQLAEMIDVSDSYISYIETARKKASLETLTKIANSLGATVDQILLGNQTNGDEYLPEIKALISDCSLYEKTVILENARSLKQTLRESENIRENEADSRDFWEI